MINRCEYKRHTSYPHYGGRGIKICSRWRQSFVQFLADVGLRPSPDHTLGRLDNDGNYEPGNVAWQTRAEQGKNRSNNIKLTAFGRTMILADWARELGLDGEMIRLRLKRGWDPEKALSKESFVTAGGVDSLGRRYYSIKNQ